MAGTAQQFNSTLLDLIHDLNTAMPGHSELSLAETLFGTFVQAQGSSCIMMDKFWEFAHDKKAAIDAKDATVLFDTLNVLVPRADVVKTLWESLSTDNQDVVFRYLAALHDLAREGHGDTTEGASIDDGTGLYLVYNNMWREFLEHMLKNLGSDDHMHKHVRHSIDRLRRLLEKKGEGSGVVYSLLAPALAPVLPEADEVTQEKLMQQMMPPNDPIATVTHDAAVLTGVRFSLSKTLTFAEILEGVLSSEAVTALATYWHFLKLITFTLGNCPKEVLAVMSNLAKTLTSGMRET